MDKKYISSVRQLTARPRSKRLRELGGTIVGGGNVNVSVEGGGIAPIDPNGHRHSNLDVLERITTDDQDYICLNEYVEETDPDTGEETGNFIPKKERAKVGFADLAGALAEEAMQKLMEMFLRKDQDDRTPFKLNVGEKVTAEKGIQIGESFVPGVLNGSGGFFDEFANGEVENLIIRRFLEVPELRFNRVEIKLGDKWNAPGAGLLESVLPDYDEEGNILTTGTGWLKLEEGEYGAIAVGDICMGIFHSMNTGENATEDSDDSRGNFQFAGFYTCYFTITEITGKDNRQFRYQMRPVSDRWGLTIHPSEAMTFVCYGSFTREDRQTSVYTTRTYTRLLKNQNTWEIGASNIAMQYGNMENMSVHGIDMTGYSMYLNNIYMTGVLKQIKPDGTPMLVANDRGDYIGGTTYDYYDRVSHNGSLWLCVSENGTETEPAKENSDWLLQVAAGDSLTATGRFSSSNAPYQPSSLVEFANKVWISMETTSNAPYDCWTDNNGNRLLFNDGGFILKDDTKNNTQWQVLIDISGFTDGKDGAGLIVQYSANKTNWHDTFVQGSDVYMRQKVGDCGVWSSAMRIVGEDGQSQEGVYTDFQFAVGSSLTEAPTSGWQDGPPSVGIGKYLWMRVCVVNPNTGTQTSWKVTRIGGEKGNGIEKVTEYYQVSSSNTSAPSDWLTTMPTLSASNRYLWNYEVIAYTDGSSVSTTPVVIGMYSEDGNGIKSVAETYGLSADAGIQPSSWSSSMPTPTEANRYLWNQTVTTYTNGSSSSLIRLIAVLGDKGDSMSLQGRWTTGHAVPYLGVVTMGGSSWSAKNATSNPPLWCWTDESGNRLLFEDGGYAITGDENTVEYQKVASDGATGAKGDKGDKGEKGDTGLQGLIVRDSEWASGVEYRNDEGVSGGFLDVVLVRDDSATTGWVAYKCKRTHVSSADITYSNTSYWEEFGANVSAIFTSLIIAKNAKITFLQGNQLLIQKSDGTVTAGMSGSEDGNKVRFWAGSSTPDSAPFQVREDGTVVATKAEITGVVNATGGEFENVTISGSLRTPWKQLVYKKIYTSSDGDVYGFDGSAYYDDKVEVFPIVNSEIIIGWGDTADGREVAVRVNNTNNTRVYINVPSGYFAIDHEGNKLSEGSVLPLHVGYIHYLTGCRDCWVVNRRIMITG